MLHSRDLSAIDPVVWVISDGRGETGNLNACRGIAHRLATSDENIVFHDIKQIEAHGGIHAYLKDIKDAQEPPDYVVSFCENTAPYAASIKKILSPVAQKPITAIQIRDPKQRYEEFDVIAVPHFEAIDYHGSNRLDIGGVPHNVTAENMRAGYALWQDALSPFKGHFTIAVLLGGDVPRIGALTEDMAREFGKEINHLAKEHHACLLVTNSFRTNEASWKAFMGEITDVPAFFHDVRMDKQNTLRANPYQGMLEAADAVVVTADSMSMCSEIAATGKPLFIAPLDGSHLRADHKKHGDFLIAQGYAEPLGSRVDGWAEKERPAPMDVTGEIISHARQIHEKKLAASRDRGALSFGLGLAG